MQKFLLSCTALGFPHFDATSSATLQASFDAIEDADKQRIMRLLCVRPMKRVFFIV